MDDEPTGELPPGKRPSGDAQLPRVSHGQSEALAGLVGIIRTPDQCLSVQDYLYPKTQVMAVTRGHDLVYTARTTTSDDAHCQHKRIRHI
jgi:hypothetical protein